jgi:hypothetical protein
MSRAAAGGNQLPRARIMALSNWLLTRRNSSQGGGGANNLYEDLGVTLPRVDR